MCGIAGFVDFNSRSSEECLKGMISTLSHRGPDNSNSNFNKEEHYVLGLAHARLSIIDLSDSANQPMRYEQFQIVFNGEIYNFQEIKQELVALNHKFKLESDTEVILHSYQQWGLKCVDKFVGMFAFVIYDKIENKLVLFRDRAGIKPLYYYFKDGLFVFSSELKAIIKHSSISKKISYEAVGYFFKYNCIPSPFSIYEDIFKFKSGHYGVLDFNTKNFDLMPYWNLDDFYNKDKESKETFEEATINLEKIITKAIRYRTVADVPIGVFLSGGYDSTLVAAILQKENNEKIKTFTIGFDQGNNEAPYAKKIAEHLGTDHHEYYCSAKDALEIIKELPYFFDEPFADSSAIPTTLVSKLSSQKVKVVISADGGDEIFFGYDNYNLIDKYSKIVDKYFKFQMINKPIAFLIFQLAKFYPNTSFNRRKLKGLAIAINTSKEYRDSILFEKHSTVSNDLVNALLKKKSDIKSIYKKSIEGFKDKMSLFIALDYSFYMQNDMLVKVDRTTMSKSIEGREPFLDHNLFEYVASLPTDFKFFKGEKKRIQKKILFKYIPKDLFVQKKQGFTVPIYIWLQNELSFLIDENLNQQEIKKIGFFNEKFVAKLVVDFKKDKLKDPRIIWQLLMFVLWHKEWME